MCCVCVLSSLSFWTSGLWTYQPGSHNRKWGYTEFLHLPFAVLAFIFLATRMQPFLSLADREAGLFCNDLIVLHLLDIYQVFFVRKNPSSCGDTEIRTRPNVRRFRGTRAIGQYNCCCCSTYLYIVEYSSVPVVQQSHITSYVVYCKFNVVISTVRSTYERYFRYFRSITLQ